MTRDSAIDKAIRSYGRAAHIRGLVDADEESKEQDWMAAASNMDAGEAILRAAIAEPAPVVITPEMVERGATALSQLGFTDSSSKPFSQRAAWFRERYLDRTRIVLEAALAREATDGQG